MRYFKITYHYIHFHCTFAHSEEEAIDNLKWWYWNEYKKTLKDCDINGVELV